MEKVTQRFIKSLVKDGTAIDLTQSSNRGDAPAVLWEVAYSAGVYGCNGVLLKDDKGQLYAVTARSTALYIFH